MLLVFEEADKKNKTLASWTKERVEQVSRMTALWDNFQAVLDNHQYLLGKQVCIIINSLKLLDLCTLECFKRFQHLCKQFEILFSVNSVFLYGMYEYLTCTYSINKCIYNFYMYVSIRTTSCCCYSSSIVFMIYWLMELFLRHLLLCIYLPSVES
jgi:hypothetical protein